MATLKDRISRMDPNDAVRGALGIVHGIQGAPKEMQFMAVAILFSVMCEWAHMDINVALDLARRIGKDGDISRNLSALQDYVKSEVR